MAAWVSVLTGTILNGLIFGTMLALTAIGLALIYGVLDVPNFAQGEYSVLAGFSTFALVESGINLIPSAIISLLLVMVAGVATEHILIARFYERDNFLLYAFFSTFAIALAFEELLRIYFGDTFVKIPSPLPQDLIIFGFHLNFLRVLTGLSAIGALFALYAFTRYTHTGLSMRALADDPEGARIIGLNKDKLYKTTFGMGALISGTTGILYGMLFSLTPSTGFGITIFAFVIVVAGGVGSFLGTTIMSLVVGLIESLTATYIGGRYSLFSVFLLLFILLAFRPGGLFGEGS